MELEPFVEVVLLQRFSFHSHHLSGLWVSSRDPHVDAHAHAALPSFGSKVWLLTAQRGNPRILREETINLFRPTAQHQEGRGASGRVELKQACVMLRLLSGIHS